MTEHAACEVAEDRLNRNRKFSRIRATGAIPVYVSYRNRSGGYNAWQVLFENGKSLVIRDK